MKTTNPRRMLAAALAASCALVASSHGQVTFQQATNGLVAFYPLDFLNPDGASTPDLLGRRDLLLSPATSAANIIASTRPGNAVSNCFNLTQSPGATVLYYPSTGMDALTGEGDFLPLANQRTYTMNMWIKLDGAASPVDRRFFGEADNTGAQNGPLWLIGVRNADGVPASRAYFLLRDNTAGATQVTLEDGTFQTPTIGQRVQGSHNTSLPVLDGSWRMLTLTRDTNGSYNVYVDGVLDTGPAQDGTQQVDFYGNPAVLPYVYTTNAYYTTNVYPSAGVSNPPPRGYVSWVFPGMYKTGSTAFGGFKRGGITAGAPCQIDDVAMWNRALSPEEIQFVMTNGLPGLPFNTNVINIVSFTASFAEVASGDQVTLSWNLQGVSTAPGSIVITGVGDVSALGLIGSTNIVLTGNQTYNFTLTAHNGFVTDKSASVSVRSFPGVKADWHLVQRFDGLFSDTVNGISGNGWVSAQSDFAGNKDRWNVVTLNTGGGTNKVLTPRSGYDLNAAGTLGFNTRGALSYARLNTLTMEPGDSSTLFFRFSLREPGPVQGLTSDLDAAIGLTDANLIGPLVGTGGIAGAGNVGPFISIVRDGGQQFAGGPFDLRAQDYGGAGVTNNYSYIASVNPNGLETNVNYYVWMDIQNRNTRAFTNQDTTTMTIDEPLFSVWLQKQGETTRTLLFTNFQGNRDYIGFNQVTDNPTPFLDKMFVSIADEDFNTGVAGAYFATNMIAVDDFYLSRNGFSGSIPKLFDLTSIVRNPSGVTIRWNSLGSMFGLNTYSVQRKLSLTEPAWTTVATGVASGGDVTTYNDGTIGASDTGYYRLVWP
ncbi:MAG TPA: hypothetical protein VEH04_01035 [Verrucomicrobiae bacterium]|nr:hypothetical protein [Verrucomicrobiae bacterium]